MLRNLKFGSVLIGRAGCLAHGAQLVTAGMRNLRLLDSNCQKFQRTGEGMGAPFQEGKIVSKPWGEELWIADGVRTPYALKKILFKSGFRSSLQVHQFKAETNFVLSGEGRFQIWTEKFDTGRFLAGAMPQSELDDFLKDVLEVQIGAGDIIDVKPERLHRVIAVSDLTFIEASTVELDDVIRISDDAQRGHGKIEDEHRN